MSLQWIGQDDFAAGTLVGSSQEQQPGVGLEQAINGVFDDDGDVWRRGPLVRIGAAAAPGPLTFNWSGVLGNQYVELATTATHTYKVQGGAFIELAAVGLDRPVLGAVVGDRIFLPNGFVWDGVAVTTMVWPPVLPAGPRHLGTAFGRLIVAVGNVVTFSAADDPLTFAPTDFHKLPDGVAVRAVWGIRDQVLLFTNYGLFSIGGMAFDLTDDLGNPQHSVNRLTPEISLLHEAGLADWAGVVVAPCLDRAFLIDGLSPPVPITDSIGALYMGHVRHGHQPGGAKVFRNHYFLPWIAEGGSHALFVCRLNRPVKGRQVYYPWAVWQGYPEGIAAFDVDLNVAPLLRGVHKDGWRVDVTGTLPPFTSEASVSDPDGTRPVFDVETRDFPTGNGQPNHVRKLRLFYVAVGGGDIEAGYSYGEIAQRYQDVIESGRTYAQVAAYYSSYEALAKGVRSADPVWAEADRHWFVFDPQHVPAPGVEPLLWNFEQAERQRFVRARFRSTDGIAQIKLRRIQFAVRPSSHER